MKIACYGSLEKLSRGEQNTIQLKNVSKFKFCVIEGVEFSYDIHEQTFLSTLYTMNKAHN